MIPLASDLLPFPGQMRREDLFEVRQSARPTFFIRPHNNSGHYFLEVSRGTSRSVDKSPAVWQSSHRKRGTDRLYAGGGLTKFRAVEKLMKSYDNYARGRCFKHHCSGRILTNGRTKGGPLQRPTPTDAVCPRDTSGDKAKPLAARSADGFAV
jgi:hypothetical protein